MEFFLPMIPPTATHQEKAVRMVGGACAAGPVVGGRRQPMTVPGKPVFYDPPQLQAARSKLTAHLAGHRPEAPLEGAVRLVVKWCFPRGRHAEGEYRSTRPDTDNLQKLLKDCMTAAGFWRDDAQVACEVVEKFWAQVPGIYVCAEEIR